MKITEETTLGELNALLDLLGLEIEAQLTDNGWVLVHSVYAAHDDSLAKALNKLIQKIDSAVER